MNCVIPGAVDTPLLKKLSTSTERNTMARFSALGKIAKPDGRGFSTYHGANSSSRWWIISSLSSSIYVIFKKSVTRFQGN
ncbi:hypothetical protein CG478_004885 [Bacillus cytotoxicus]|nr:hypothetical protein CG480_004885 [Bacillus cytotoxicus]AWC47821.1 hypothetical protein CG478_004885 [Bacillus cytotoxicus]